MNELEFFGLSASDASPLSKTDLAPSNRKCRPQLNIEMLPATAVEPPVETLPRRLRDTVEKNQYPSAEGDELIHVYPFAELGNAALLEERHSIDLRYVQETGGWLFWDDNAWIQDPDGAKVRLLAASLGKYIYALGGMVAQHHREQFSSWSTRSIAARAINHTVALLSDSADVRLHASLLDSDPWIVGYDGGRMVIDLRSGETRPAERADLVTKSLGVDALGKPEACPRWLQFLQEVFVNSSGATDHEDVSWIQRWCGYMLTGLTREQIVVFAVGCGRNGKSVFGNVIQRLMGEYCRTLPAESLMVDHRRSGSGPSPDLAVLVGARLLLSSESEDGAQLAEARMKVLTGGDAITCRQLYAQPITFTPAFKALIQTNHKPNIKGTDHGIWRRIRLAEFRARFDDGRNDPHLTDKLMAELPGIAAWAVAGCLEWQKFGLEPAPASIIHATAHYREDMDTLADFLRTCCLPQGEVLASDLYARYRRWADDNGIRPMSSQALGRSLTERQYIRRRSRKGPVYEGLSLYPGIPPRVGVLDSV